MGKKKKVKSELSIIRQQLFDLYSPGFFRLQKILQGVHNKSSLKPEADFKDLYSLLCNKILLMQALGKIRPNKGSSADTAGVDFCRQTLDGMEEN